ncbi:MAG TPA: glycosyltransferase [Burkholderiaceae bacterium]|nr:glycosyltransferase [Burkholderiaceae bacterium]
MTTPSLRIALISEHASPLAGCVNQEAGSQNIYVAHVARELASMGHQVDVLTRRDACELPRVAHPWPGVRVLHIDAGPPHFVAREALLPHMPAFAEAARRRLCGAQPYDVVHANFFMSGLVGMALRLSLGVPLVTTLHSLEIVRRQHHVVAEQFPPARVGIERALVQQSDRLIAECPQDVEDLTRLYGALPGRISTIPCGVDTQAFRPGDKAAARQRLGLPADRFLMLHLGRLVRRKGLDNVIEAMARMAPGNDAHLLVVGGTSPEPDERLTPEIGRLRDLAAGHGLADRVEFVGRLEHAELPDWYVAADVFVSTPTYEPFGIAPLEAMACGLPVVGSRVGGMEHTVINGLTGFLVPPMDPDALAERLDVLRGNPEIGARMGSSGVGRVRRYYTWTQVAEQLACVYADVAAAHKLRAARGAAAEISVRAVPDLSRSLPGPHLPRSRAAASAGSGGGVRP